MNSINPTPVPVPIPRKKVDNKQVSEQISKLFILTRAWTDSWGRVRPSGTTDDRLEGEPRHVRPRVSGGWVEPHHGRGDRPLSLRLYRSQLRPEVERRKL